MRLACPLALILVLAYLFARTLSPESDDVDDDEDSGVAGAEESSVSSRP